MKRTAQGFTLIEVAITVAIVGILSAVALPAFQHYQRKAAYAEVLVQASPVKNAVHTCLAVEQSVAKCGTLALLGITPPSATKAFHSLTVDVADLTIRLTPKPYKGIRSTDTCELKPVLDRSGRISGWFYEPNSPCVTEGYVKP